MTQRTLQTKVEFKETEIILYKKPSILDEIVMDFTDILTDNNIKYVIFSGFIPVLFGKHETCNDIDLLIHNISFEKFLKLWLEIENSYECKNTNDPVDAYNAYLKNFHAVNLTKKERHIPEFRIKIVKNAINRYILKYRKKAILGDRNLFISPLEIEIPHNLFLGSAKAIVDAGFLKELAGEKLNLVMMDKFISELNIPKESVDKYLKSDLGFTEK